MTDMITTQVLQRRLDTRTKPQGSLGALESLAIQLGSVLQTETPVLRSPAVFVFAARPRDRGGCRQRISAVRDRADAGELSQRRRSDQRSLESARARSDRHRCGSHPAGRRAQGARPPSWIAPGTRNFRFEPAMSAEQCTRAIETGRTFATDAIARGSNALLLGEMGIGNTACAAMLLHRRTDWPLADCVGRGTGTRRRSSGTQVPAARRIVRALSASLVAVRNAGGIRRLRARDAHRRDARSRTASLHRGRRRFRGERRGAARDRNGCARARALCLQPLLGRDRASQASRTSASATAARPAPAARRRIGRGAGVAADRIGGATHDRDGELRIRWRRRPRAQ